MFPPQMPEGLFETYSCGTKTTTDYSGCYFFAVALRFFIIIINIRYSKSGIWLETIAGSWWMAITAVSLGSASRSYERSMLPALDLLPWEGPAVIWGWWSPLSTGADQAHNMANPNGAVICISSDHLYTYYQIKKGSKALAGSGGTPFGS